MNTEYVWWFLILVAMGIGVVIYLALGPVPEIEATPGPAASTGDDAPGGLDPVESGDPDQGAPGDAPASAPVSTSLPGPAEPAATNDTP